MHNIQDIGLRCVKKYLFIIACNHKLHQRKVFKNDPKNGHK
jgi:hypothetical protein